LDQSSIATEYRDGMLTVRIRPEVRKHGNSH
jgi:hypothetical protein